MLNLMLGLFMCFWGMMKWHENTSYALLTVAGLLLAGHSAYSVKKELLVGVETAHVGAELVLGVETRGSGEVGLGEMQDGV